MIHKFRLRVPSVQHHTNYYDRSRNQQADYDIARLVAVQHPAPDKATQQLAWVAHMNSLKAQAEEIVLRELVYEEDIV